MDSIIELDANNFWKNRQSPYESLKRAAALFEKIQGKIIIEIGTGIQGEQSGNSVLVWGNQTSAEKIYCLDLEQKHIQDVQDATKSMNNVEAIKIDGLKFIKNFKGKIDLLYLDFWVSDKTGDVPGTARAIHYLKAFKLAKKKLSNQSIILIDDTDHVDPWKHTYIVPEARKHGFDVLWCGRQTCLFRN
jgi:predicted O-methyltransferase YrrM